MRLIKTHFHIDSPSLSENESEIISHGALFSWLEMGGLEGPIVLCIDLEGFQGDAYTLVPSLDKERKPIISGSDSSLSEEKETGKDHKTAGNSEAHHAHDGTDPGSGWLGGWGVDMKWLTAAQPSGANLIVSASHPAAVKTARDLYFWPIVEMESMTREESEGLTNQWLGSRCPSHGTCVLLHPFPSPSLFVRHCQ